MIIFYVETLHVLQNQSFLSFAPAVCVFLVTVTCRLLIIISTRWLLNFVFCVVSFRTSRYVLICCTRLTHFLCCNLFVMSYLTLSAISANILEIRLPSLSITVYAWLIPSQIACNPLPQRFPRMFSKFARVTLRDPFCEEFTELTHLYTLPYGGWWLALANFANVLKTRVAVCRTRHPCFLNY